MENLKQKIQQTISSLKANGIPEEFIEVEIRYGSMVQNRNTHRTNFVSGIPRRNYIQLITFLENTFDKNNFISITSIDRVYQESQNDTSERYTTIFNNEDYPVEYLKTLKKSFLKYDIPDYLMRVGISIEQTEKITQEQEPKTSPLWMREKKRKSLLIADLRFDLTEVTSTHSPATSPSSSDSSASLTSHKHPHETIYEVEIELKPRDGKSKLDNELLNKFQSFALLLYKDIIGSSRYKITKLLVPKSLQYDLINRINAYIGSKWSNSKIIDNTVITNARTIKARDLTMGALIPNPVKQEIPLVPGLASAIIEKTNNSAVAYTMTIKADGILKLFVIDTSGLYFMGPPDNTIRLSNTIDSKSSLSEFVGCVFIGELVQKISDKQPLFLFFDVLSWQGNYQIQTLIFEQRLARIQQFMNAVGKSLSALTGGVEFKIKDFSLILTPEQFYSQTNEILDKNYDFDTDGLICTPYNYGYHTTLTPFNVFSRHLNTDPDILKIKKTDDLTIDFELRRENNENGEFQLYSSNGPKPAINFIGSKEYPFNPLVNLEVNDAIRSAPTGTIIEFKWDNEKEKFIYTRTRDDKNTANGINIALDVWSDIHNPIEEKTIRGKQFALSFRYHNTVKSKIHEIMSIVTNPAASETGIYLLSIGAGRGGDVYKWVKNKITHVVCVEPDEENRKELQKRLENTGIQFLILPNFGQDVQEIVNKVGEFIPGGKVHYVTYMLSLSFFFDTVESVYSVLNLVTSVLLPKGTFGFLTIDGRYVLEYFKNENNRTYIADKNEYKAKLNMITLIYKPKESGFSQIYIDIPDSKIVHDQTEYLTNIPKLIELFQTNGYKLIREERTDKEYFMTPEELIYVSLFSYAVLQKE